MGRPLTHPHASLSMSLLRQYRSHPPSLPLRPQTSSLLPADRLRRRCRPSQLPCSACRVFPQHRAHSVSTVCQASERPRRLARARSAQPAERLRTWAPARPCLRRLPTLTTDAACTSPLPQPVRNTPDRFLDQPSNVPCAVQPAPCHEHETNKPTQPSADSRICRAERPSSLAAESSAHAYRTELSRAYKPPPPN
ncbi:UNVERIFIED_CONTAM: hypothetical protein Sangu_2829300 [Sesamum angustifolium]|uniref:Uncharacterized protein n=1 Tax=Sesamum angustifolium TaxID=2727405 RepID=A0AAW2IQV5_9LAMI